MLEPSRAAWKGPQTAVHLADLRAAPSVAWTARYWVEKKVAQTVDTGDLLWAEMLGLWARTWVGNSAGGRVEYLVEHWVDTRAL